MQTDYERYIKMSSLAQIGWWEADFAAGHYLFGFSMRPPRIRGRYHFFSGLPRIDT